VPSSPGPSLDGCFIKLGRASQHRKALDVALGPAKDAICEAVVTETTYHDNTGQFVVQVAYAPAIPPGISVIAGDVIHNLRSALEYAAYQAVWKALGSPWEDSQFPITSTPTKFKCAATVKKLAADPDLLAVVKRNQPYDAVDDYRREGLAVDLEDIINLRQANRLLALLRDISNADKHRLLLPRYARAIDAVFVPRRVTDCDPVVSSYQEDGALVAGTQLAVFTANATGPHPDMDVDFSFRPSVGLAGFGDAQEVLDALAVKVLRVIRELEPLI
jgi:hypothetical protein